MTVVSGVSVAMIPSGANAPRWARVKIASRCAATITVAQANGLAVVEVADDGTGGADPDGSGLRGLADRVEAVGGRLTIQSPPGHGTTVRAELPCA